MSTAFQNIMGRKDHIFLFVTEKLINSKPWLAEQKKTNSTEISFKVLRMNFCPNLLCLLNFCIYQCVDVSWSNVEKSNIILLISIFQICKINLLYWSNTFSVPTPKKKDLI